VLGQLDRQARRRGAAGAGCEHLLDQAVLEGVVGQHRDAPAYGQGGDCRRQGGLEGGQLAVDLHPQRLERPLGRVAAGPPGRRGHGRPDELDEAGAGAERLPPTFADHRLGDPPGEALLSVRVEHFRQLDGGVGVEHLGRGDACPLVHAHVQGGVVRVGEAPAGLVELQRADAQVEEHPVDTRDPEVGQYPGHRVVDRVHESRALRHGRQPTAGQRQRRRVAVEADEARLWAPCQELPRVAARA
jgi:hypothetical protein